MKYEQAFYTWGKNQISFSKEGLGICASSRMDKEFLDKCMSLGSRFASEAIERTTQFTFYDSGFDSYVGVGVSPYEEAGDQRTNKLCHLIIPVEKNSGAMPEDYLLSYPFQREVEGVNLPTLELDKEFYDYYEILKKYRYDGSDARNIKRLAKLLWKVYPCVFREESNLFLVINRDVHQNEEEYAQIAKDLTWLLCMLVPRPLEYPDLFSKHLSYGVYTVQNASAACLIFTDRVGFGKNELFLDEDVEEEIPVLYMEMAERAQKSIDELQEFILALYKIRYSRELNSAQLPKLYYRWKLEQGMEVTRKEMGSEFVVIYKSALESRWHRRFMLDFFNAKSTLEMDEMVDYWQKLIAPCLKHYESLKEDEKESLEHLIVKSMCSMFPLSQRNYRLMKKNVPTELQRTILLRTFENGKSCMDLEYEAMQTSADLRSFVEGYGVLVDEKELRDKVMQFAMLIYDTSEREARSEITEVMSRLDREAWDVYLYDRYQSEETCQSFAQKILAEKDKIEFKVVSLCYQLLLGRAELAADEDMPVVLECEEMLKNMEYGGIDRLLIRKFEKLINSRKENRLKNVLMVENLEDLLKHNISDLQFGSCVNLWIRRIFREIPEAKAVSLDEYRTLLQKMIDMYYMMPEKEAINKADYIKYLWIGAKEHVSERILRCLEFQTIRDSIGQFEKKYCVWNVIDEKNYEADYQEIYRLLQQDTEKAGIMEHLENYATEFHARHFAVWKAVQDGVCLSLHEYPSDGKGRSYDTQDLLNKMSNKILNKQYKEYRYADIYNYFVLQCWLDGHFTRDESITNEYKRIKRRYGTFVEVVFETPIQENYEETVKNRWEHMKASIGMTDFEEVTKDNLLEVSRLLRQFGNKKEAKELREKRDSLMRKIELECDELQRKIDKYEREIERLKFEKKQNEELYKSAAKEYPVEENFTRGKREKQIKADLPPYVDTARAEKQIKQQKLNLEETVGNLADIL